MTLRRNALPATGRATSDPTDRDLEIVECEASADIFSAVPPEVAASLGVSWTRLGTSILVAMRNVPVALFNQSQGLGAGEAITERTIGIAIAWLREHCAPTWEIEAAPEAITPHFKHAVEAAGLRRDLRGTAKFRRGTDPAPQRVSTSLDVREVGPRDAFDFARAAQASFDLLPDFVPWLVALVGRPGWHIYVAYDGSSPVAAGTLFAKDDCGWLGIGGTLPAYRGRGAQSAILHRRLSDGIAEGLTRFTVETPPPIDGEDERAFPSYRNLFRAGFELAYIREKYGPAAPLDDRRNDEASQGLQT